MVKTKIIAVAGIGEANFRKLHGEPNTESYKKETDRLESGVSDKFDEWGKQGYDYFMIITGEEQKGDAIPEKVAKRKGLKYKVIREPSIADVRFGLDQGRFSLDDIPFIKTTRGFARKVTPDMQENIDRIKASEWFSITTPENKEDILNMEKDVKAGKKYIDPMNISVGGDRQYRNNVVIIRAEEEAKKLDEPVDYLEIHSIPYNARDRRSGSNATRRKHQQHDKHNKKNTIYNYIGFLEESKSTESKPPVKKSTSSKPTTDKFKSYQGTIGFSPIFKSPKETTEPPEIEPDDSFVTFPYSLGLPADESADAPDAKPVVLTPEQEEEIKARQQFEGQSKIKTKEKIFEAPWSKTKGKKRLKMIAKHYSKELASFGEAGKKPFDVSSIDWSRTKKYVKDRGIPKSKQEIMKRHSLALQQKSPEKLEIKRKIISEKEFSESLKDIPKTTSILDDTRVDYTGPKLLWEATDMGPELVEADADKPEGIHVIRNYTLPSGKIIKELKPNRADYQELVQSMGKEKAEKYIANAWLGGGLNPYGQQYTFQRDVPDIKKFKVKKGVPIHGPARPGERRRSAYFGREFDKLITGPQTEMRRVLHTDKKQESKEESKEEIIKSGMNHPLFSTLKSQQEKEREKEAIKHKDELQKLADEHRVDVKATKDMSEADKLRKEYGMGEQYHGGSLKSVNDVFEHIRLNPQENIQNALVDTGEKIIDSRGHEAIRLETVAQATNKDIINMPESEYTAWFFSQLGRRQKYVDSDAKRIAGWAYYQEGHDKEGEKIVYLKGNEVVDSSNPQGKRTLTQEEIKAGKKGGIPSYGDVFKTSQWQHFNDDTVKPILEQRKQEYVGDFEFKGVQYNNVSITKNIAGEEFDADGNRIPLRMIHKDGEIPLVLTYTGDKQQDMKEFNMTEAEYDEHFTNNNPERVEKWKRDYEAKIAEDNTYVSRRPNETEQQFNKRKQEYDPDNTGWTKYERQFMKKEGGKWVRDVKAEANQKAIDFNKANVDGEFKYQKGDKAYYTSDRVVTEPLVFSEEITAAFNAVEPTKDQIKSINEFKNFVERDTFDSTGGAHQIMDSSARDPRTHGDVVGHDDTGDLYTSGHGDVGSGGRLGSHIGKAGDPVDQALLGPGKEGYSPEGLRVYLKKDTHKYMKRFLNPKTGLYEYEKLKSHTHTSETEFPSRFDSKLLNEITIVAKSNGDTIEKDATKTEYDKKNSFGYGVGDYTGKQPGHATSTTIKSTSKYNQILNKISNPDNLFPEEKEAWNSLTPMEKASVINVIDYNRGDYESPKTLDPVDKQRYNEILLRRSDKLERGSPSATLEDGTPNPKARFVPKHKYLISSDIRHSLDSEGNKYPVSPEERDAQTLSSFATELANEKIRKELDMTPKEFEDYLALDYRKKSIKNRNLEKKIKYETHKALPEMIADAIKGGHANKKFVGNDGKTIKQDITIDYLGGEQKVIDEIRGIMYEKEPPKYLRDPTEEEQPLEDTSDTFSQQQDIEDYTDTSDLIEGPPSEITKDAINDLTNNIVPDKSVESKDAFDEFKKGTLKFEKDADKDAESTILPSAKEIDEKQEQVELKRKEEAERRERELFEKSQNLTRQQLEKEAEAERLRQVELAAAAKKAEDEAAKEAAKTAYARATESKTDSPPAHGINDPIIEANIPLKPLIEKATITDEVVKRILETPNTIAFNRNSITNVNGHSYKFTDGKAKIMKIGGKTISEVSLPDLAKYADGSFQFVLTEDPSTVHATTKTEAEITEEIKNSQATKNMYDKPTNGGGPTNYYTSDTNGKTGEERTKAYDKKDQYKSPIGPTFVKSAKKGTKRWYQQQKKADAAQRELDKRIKNYELAQKTIGSIPSASEAALGIGGALKQGISGTSSTVAEQLQARRDHKYRMALLKAQGGGNRAGTMESMANFAKMLDAGQQRGGQFGRGQGLFSERDTAAMMGSGQSRLTDFSIQGRSQSSALTDFAGRVGQQGLGLGSNLAGQMMTGEGTRGIFTTGREFLQSRSQPSGMQFVGQRERDTLSFSLGGTLGLGGSMRPEQGLGSPSGFLTGELVPQRQTQNRAPNGRNNGAGFRGRNSQ